MKKTLAIAVTALMLGAVVPAEAGGFHGGGRGGGFHGGGRGFGGGHAFHSGRGFGGGYGVRGGYRGGYRHYGYRGYGRPYGYYGPGYGYGYGGPDASALAAGAALGFFGAAIAGAAAGY
ncbi:hypothetical protein [Methylobacterium sp. WL12]|uniref:hypothetical protein n=1 Tax=Methylobacterium sp. WL12 TaxID=2603890 RepID=UPI001650811F|nr:hypothetical protein [Methylobacterium sp. WL12]